MVQYYWRIFNVCHLSSPLLDLVYIRDVLNGPLFITPSVNPRFTMLEPVYPVGLFSRSICFNQTMLPSPWCLFSATIDCISDHTGHPKESRAINLNMQINLQTPPPDSIINQSDDDDDDCIETLGGLILTHPCLHQVAPVVVAPSTKTTSVATDWHRGLTDPVACVNQDPFTAAE